MKQEKKYLLEVTEKQLSLIAQCVEDCHRFMGGQTELWHTISNLDNYSELEVRLKRLKELVTPYLEDGSYYGWNGSNCPNSFQRKFIAQTYPIYREILHFIALEKGLDNVYASETLTCEEGGEPIKIKKL